MPKYVKIPRATGDKVKLTEQAKAMGVDQEFYYDDEEEPKPALTAVDQKEAMKAPAATSTVADTRTKATPDRVVEASPYVEKKAALKSLNASAEGMSSLIGYVDKALPPLTAMGLKKKIQAMTPQQQSEIWAKLQSIPKAVDKDNYLLQLQ